MCLETWEGQKLGDAEGALQDALSATALAQTSAVHFGHALVSGVCCVFLGSTEAALMANFAKSKRQSRLNFANFAMRATWLRAISHTTPARHHRTLNFLLTVPNCAPCLEPTFRP